MDLENKLGFKESPASEMNPTVRYRSLAKRRAMK